MLGRGTIVVVSGGTSRNEALQVRLKHMCEEEGLPPPVFTDTFDMDYE